MTKCPMCGEPHELSQCPRWKAPTACDNCAKARAGLWCGYAASCPDCVARAIARSLPAFNALHPRGSDDAEQLRATILRALHETEYSTARRMVWAWWQHDHPALETPAA